MLPSWEFNLFHITLWLFLVTSDIHLCRCDVCVKAPPESVNVKEEANIFLQAIAAYHVSISIICSLPPFFILISFR